MVFLFMCIVISFLSPNPTKTPGITKIIGKKMGPINNPKILIFAEYINPIVTKYAANTNGRNNNEVSFPLQLLASRTASHIEKK